MQNNVSFPLWKRNHLLIFLHQSKLHLQHLILDKKLFCFYITQYQKIAKPLRDKNVIINLVFPEFQLTFSPIKNLLVSYQKLDDPTKSSLSFIRLFFIKFQHKYTLSLILALIIVSANRSHQSFVTDNFYHVLQKLCMLYLTPLLNILFPLHKIFTTICHLIFVGSFKHLYILWYTYFLRFCQKNMNYFMHKCETISYPPSLHFCFTEWDTRATGIFISRLVLYPFASHHYCYYTVCTRYFDGSSTVMLWLSLLLLYNNHNPTVDHKAIIFFN